ncbi:MAG: hypothetical protein LUC92_07115 [Clostridiales bacterium]|nr:hypothetical protein [Clostridiales bacterium]
MKYFLTLFMTAALSLGFAFSAGAASSKSAAVTTTTEETEETTEETTETTTAFVPTDENGNPLTGADLICYNTLAKYKKWGANPIESEYYEETLSEGTASVAKKTITYGTGDTFWLKRYSFPNSAAVEETTSEGSTETTTVERYETSLYIPGSGLEIRAYNNSTGEWFRTANLETEIIKEVIFLDTDSYHMILGLPAVYKNNDFVCNTLTVVPDLEQPIKITQTDGGYKINFSFPESSSYLGEIWCLESSRVLADWENTDLFSLLHINLASDRRLCYDGYYFQTPTTYTPGGENILYRQPSNYTGSALISYSNIPAAYDLGYATTYICAQNQNAEGYWATGPQSEWLYSDFGITSNFYDTRFNTDFASNLIAAYRLYYDEVFLKALLAYGDFFNKHAANNHYETENGGWLVEDYGGQEGYTRTHCSLNHQLAEMCVLYKISYITGVKSYKETADNMLKGIEDTRDEWVQINNNLNYALYYTGSEELVDYPYLTYNDLYTTQQILYTYYHYTNDTLDYLMKCKKIWMDENNITGYYTTQQVVN